MLSIGVFLFGRDPPHSLILLLLALPLLLLLILLLVALQIFPKKLVLPVPPPARVELLFVTFLLSFCNVTSAESPLLQLLTLPPEVDIKDAVEEAEVRGVDELADDDDQLRRNRLVGIKLCVCCVHGCIFSTKDGIESHFTLKNLCTQKYYWRMRSPYDVILLCILCCGSEFTFSLNISLKTC